MTKILVADDEPMIRQLLKEMLETEGYDVCEAVNGKDTCEAVTRDSPDLVILDVMMPLMDGFQVLKVLREDPATVDLPVVMLTSTPAAVGEQAAKEYGAAHYISKPWQPDTVQAAVRMALRGAADQKPGGPPKILVADDEPMIRELLKEMLEADGYDVIEAANGKAVCEAISEALPDLVLLDVQMPVMSGFEVLKVLRDNPGTANLPIVMLTSTAAVVGEQAALGYGVSSYISKPWPANMVQAAVRIALRDANVPIPVPPADEQPDEDEPTW